jgi:hypothetical protein
MASRPDGWRLYTAAAARNNPGMRQFSAMMPAAFPPPRTERRQGIQTASPG